MDSADVQQKRIQTGIARLDEELRKQDAARYIKFDFDQLLALLTAILVAGKCFQDQDDKSVANAERIACVIVDRVIHRQDYTEIFPDL